MNLLLQDIGCLNNSACVLNSFNSSSTCDDFDPFYFNCTANGQLGRLYIFQTELNGTLNNVLSELTGLTELDLYYTRFLRGTVPKLPTNLRYLRLSYNEFNGELPHDWPTGLTNIDLSYNQFNGSLSKPFPPQLNALSLFRNNFTGSLGTITNRLSVCALYNSVRENNCFTNDTCNNCDNAFLASTGCPVRQEYNENCLQPLKTPNMLEMTTTSTVNILVFRFKNIYFVFFEKKK